MRNRENIVWGILLVVLGVIFGLNAMEVTHINIFFRGWWTLFIILPSITGIIKNPRKIGSPRQFFYLYTSIRINSK